MISKSTLYKSVFNLTLRSLSIVSRLLLVVFLGKNVQLEELGVYHLFAVSSALFVCFTGLEFYAFSSRKYVSMVKSAIGRHFYYQLIFHGISYIPTIFFVLAFFLLGFVPYDYIFFFLAITIFDHLSTESGRLLAARSYSGWFNVLYFIRSGLWIYAFIFWSYSVEPLGFDRLFWFWTVGVAASWLTGVFALISKGLWPTVLGTIDWSWISGGLKVAFPLFMLVIFMRLIDYTDRYFIEYYHGKAAVGIYGFFAGIANVSSTLVIGALSAQFVPMFVKSFSSIGKIDRKKLTFEYLGLVIFILLAVAAGVAVFLDPLLSFVGKEELTEQSDIIVIQLISATFFCLSTYPRIILYAKGLDYSLMWTGLVALVVNVCLNYYLVPDLGIRGAAYASAASWAILFAERLVLTFYIYKSS